MAEKQTNTGNGHPIGDCGDAHPYGDAERCRRIWYDDHNSQSHLHRRAEQYPDLYSHAYSSLNRHPHSRTRALADIHVDVDSFIYPP